MINDHENLDITVQDEFGSYQHYVYALLDFSAGTPEVFYIGKGQNNRLEAHEAEANKTIDFENHPKLKRIRELRAKEAQAGHPSSLFQARTIGRYKTDGEARAVEATLIKFVYGRENLTNKVHGTHHMMIRSCDSWAPVDGIDKPQNLEKYLRTGEYTDKQRDQIVKNNIVQKLLLMKESIESSPLQVEVRGPDLSKPQDPLLWISWNGGDVQIALKLQLTGENVAVGLSPLSKRTDDIERFMRRVEKGQAKRPPEEQAAFPWAPKGNGNSGAMGWYCHTRNFKSNKNEGLQAYRGGFPIDRTDLLIQEIDRVMGFCRDD